MEPTDSTDSTDLFSSAAAADWTSITASSTVLGLLSSATPADFQETGLTSRSAGAAGIGSASGAGIGSAGAAGIGSSGAAGIGRPGAAGIGRPGGPGIGSCGGAGNGSGCGCGNGGDPATVTSKNWSVMSTNVSGS